jgi:hypothetical protein
MDPETVVGVDASKDYLDIALHPQREHWRYPNNAKGLTALMARLHPFQPVRVILVQLQICWSAWYNARHGKTTSLCSLFDG